MAAASLRDNAAVALGAAAGSVARYLCSLAAISWLGPDYAWGTLAVNVAGSFLIGLYAALSAPGTALATSPTLRLFIMTGFSGGFTTFSVFSLETLLLVERGHVSLAAFHVAASLALWLAALWVGFRLGNALARPKP